jgi:type I restriction enzyme M protein
MNNKFCARSELTNEASVEARFVNPLLRDLGFAANQIRLKTSLKELKVGKGSKSALYKPDYLVITAGTPSLLIDAKSPTHPIDQFEYQCSSYCLEINKLYDYNPVDYFVLTNGVTTVLHKWDAKAPLLALSFTDFVTGNPKYQQLMSFIGRKALHDHCNKLRASLEAQYFRFEAISLNELSTKFQRVHRYIWTTEKKSPSAAFEELMKIVFVKIKKDRELHAKLGEHPRPRYKST